MENIVKMTGGSEKTKYYFRYDSPLGVMTGISDGENLCELWFSGQKYFDDKVDQPDGQKYSNPEDQPGEREHCSHEDQLVGQKYPSHEKQPNGQNYPHHEAELPVFEQTKRWLDSYFSGQIPDFLPPLSLKGTDFRMEVWEELLKIPYGKTVSYGEIAAAVARKRGLDRMSAQAVGGAVGHNPVAIIVPCHRVVGKDGSLTGYGGGLDKKTALLSLEKAEGVKLLESVFHL